jgi:ATP-dependent DNA helicase RecG
MMSNLNEDILSTKIMYLPGVGPKKAELLFNELEIITFKDLLYYFPFRYIDRTHFYTIREITPDLQDTQIQLYGEIVSAKEGTTGKGKKILIFRFVDGTGSIDLVFFNGVTWRKNKYKIGQKYIVFGKLRFFNGISMEHPEIDSPETENPGIFATNINGVYSSTDKLKNGYLGNRMIVKLMSNLLNLVLTKIPETLPDYLLNRYKLLSLPEALLNIHFPQSNEMRDKAKRRLQFEELFYIQLGVLSKRSTRVNLSKGFVFDNVGEHFNYFYNNNLPFPLTSAQKKVIKEMRNDLGTGKQMNRLLQGDVGSGKTLVALIIMLIAADNGFQSCLMAPTEILATQHFESITQFLEGMDIKVNLLTGSTKKSVRKILFNDLSEGKTNILIGTHALIEDSVQFKKLGLVIIDEQHRFGVEQRAKLWSKSEISPHILVMTATPIPRTLAMTVYGDLDVSIIDELPPGRKLVKTLLFNDSKRLRVFGFMKEQIEQGRQIYVVYPLIKESETMDYKDLEDGYASISQAFPPPEYVTVVMHGKMKPADKDFSMNMFASGKANIMVATSVIEVGVNVQNASVMIIESAERFGLSQLHQLRGRVGRGADQSFCVLMAGYKLSKESKARLDMMVSTTDGFEIAEADMKMRGPGAIEGTQQSGLPFKLRLTDLSTDGKLLEAVRKIVEAILLRDPNLSLDENKILKTNLEASASQKDFSKIS